MEQTFIKIKNMDVKSLIDSVNSLAIAIEEKIDESVFDFFEKVQLIQRNETYSDFINNYPDLSGVSFINRIGQKLEKIFALVENKQEIQDMNEYVRGMSIASGEKNMMFRIETFGAKVSINSMINGAVSYNALFDEYERLREEYIEYYVLEHNHYYKCLNEIEDRLEAIKSKVDTIDNIYHLLKKWKYDWQGVKNRYRMVEKRLTKCTMLSNQEFTESGTPYCKCRYMPEDNSLLDDIVMIEDEVESAYEKMISHMTSIISKKILTDNQKDSMDRLIKALQVADLSLLSSINSNELVATLSEILD